MSQPDSENGRILSGAFSNQGSSTGAERVAAGESDTDSIDFCTHLHIHTFVRHAGVSTHCLTLIIAQYTYVIVTDNIFNCNSKYVKIAFATYVVERH